MPDQPARQRLIVPFTGHIIGQGFNSDTFERVGTGLLVGNVGEDPVADGQTAEFRFQMVSSQESLEKALNFSAEVDARYGLFSGGAKFDFAEQNAINTSSTYIVASCVITNALRSGSQITPTPTAQQLIAAGNREGFKTAFGDRFTQALRTGGEFHAVVRTTSSSREHQRKISASLHAELNGLVAAGSFKAAFSTAQTDASSRTEVEIRVHQTAGVGAQIQIPGTDADKIKQHMNSFATAVHEHPQAFEAEVLTYDTLALPFPTLMDLEDKRRVLEDCQVRKTRYWSALSDIAFAQSENAAFFFDNLPPPEQLIGMQNEFRRVLNALMAHARAVSAGTIPPTLFVAEDEPPFPRFKRRNATSFGTWWVRRNDPDLLADESTLLNRIANEARSFLASPLEEAGPAAVERAADQIEKLDVSFFGAFDARPPLSSFEALPNMLDAPLRHVTGKDTQLEDLKGLETFARLESLDLKSAKIENVSALSSAAGLKALHLTQNRLSDLAPLRALTSLETLTFGGNRISSLEPIKELKSLGILAMSQGLLQMTEEGQPPPPFVLLDNPIVDASALKELTQFANPFINADRLHVRRFTSMTEDLVDEGDAVRSGNSNRFKISFGGGAQENMILMACFRTTILEFSVEPLVAVALHFTGSKTSGLAFTRPGEPGALMTAAEQKQLLSGSQAVGLGLLFGLVVGIDPKFAIEASVTA